MARNDFYNIKDLGEIKPEDEGRPAAAKPLKSYKQARPSKNNLPLIGLIILLILIIIGAGTWLVLKHNKTTSKPPAKSNSPSAVQPTTTTNAAGTAKYVSNGHDLNLTFSYPSNWTVTPASGNNPNDQTITLTSPLSSMTNAAGTQVTGKIVLTVRPGTSTITELNANNPVAAQTSSQIGYTTPAADQYQYPYITFIHFANGSAGSGAFEEVMITGTTQFPQGQQLSSALLTGLDPIISATFTACNNQACTGTGAVPLSITNTEWTNGAIFKQVLAVFESFQLN